MSENERYVLDVCDVIIDDEVNDRRRKKGWIDVLQLMHGVAELKDRLNKAEDDGR